MRLRCIGLSLGLGLAFATGAPAENRHDQADTLEVSQAAIGRQIASYEFLDRAGQPFTLDSLRGRPVVISMIYTSCYHICPTMTQNLARAARIGWEALGQDSFAVVTIGFDTAVDRPERMRQYADARNIDAANWYFLSGDEGSVAALAGDIGFIYFASPKGFDHAAQTTVLDADGRVYRQVYGQTFKAPTLVEPLKELVFDTPEDATFLEDWIDNVKLFCTVYDPRSGRYRFDYSIFVAAFAGIMCLGAVAIFLVRSWKHSV